MLHCSRSSLAFQDWQGSVHGVRQMHHQRRKALSTPLSHASVSVSPSQICLEWLCTEPPALGPQKKHRHQTTLSSSSAFYPTQHFRLLDPGTSSEKNGEKRKVKVLTCSCATLSASSWIMFVEGHERSWKVVEGWRAGEREVL